MCKNVLLYIYFRVRVSHSQQLSSSSTAVAMLTIAVKHALSIRGKDASMTLLGDVVSYSDCPQLIASSLCIHSFVLFEEFKDKVRGSFILGVYKTSSHADSEVVKALASLRTQSHKAALVYLNREGTIGLLRPLDEERRRGCVLERFAFECFIVGSSSKKSNEIASSSSSSFVTKKRKSESITPSLQSNPQPDLQSDQQKAADHYNSLVRDRDTRSASQIFHLRNLNGFVKSLLISTSSSKIQVLLSIPKNNLRVLDVCCGHGGDVNKWLNNNPVGVSSYVGIDIAQSGLQDFITSRLVNHKKKNAVQKLIAADIGRDSLVSSKLPCFTWKTNEWSHQIPLTLQETFHIASCQFAVHYMFESYARALHFFEEISRHLVKGGKLIITTVDCRVLRELVYQQLSSELCLPLKEKEKEVDDEEEDVVIVIRNDLGNKIVEITMEHEIVQRLLKSNEQDEEDTSNNDMFGLRYTFCLFDDPLTSTAAVNAPEWLVPLGTPLEALAAKANLKLTEMTNFHDYVTEAIKKENINSASNRFVSSESISPRFKLY